MLLFLFKPNIPKKFARGDGAPILSSIRFNVLKSYFFNRVLSLSNIYS